jgi:hypothetical protein
MRAAASTHRALEQDEVTTTTDDLLEHVLVSDNLARAWKRVKANRGAPGIDGMTIKDFPPPMPAHTGPPYDSRSESVHGVPVAPTGQYLRGWAGYFGTSQYCRPVPELDEWIRRRLRMC